MSQITTPIYLVMAEATHLSLEVPAIGMAAAAEQVQALTELMDKILAARVELVVRVVLV
jgi:hypothetical protein